VSRDAGSTPVSSGPLEETPGDWPSEWPDKYKVYDRYIVAQSKNSTIKTYLYNNEEQGYTIIEQPIPDYMITIYDYLNPITEKYDKMQIDRIVYDDVQQKICVNFNQDYITTYADDEAANKEILYSIAKTIIENYSLELNGVYIEVDMKPFMEPNIP